jgi:hypothetical protein
MLWDFKHSTSDKAGEILMNLQGALMQQHTYKLWSQ